MRSKSRTRVERRPGQLTVYYKHRGESDEHEMIRVTVEQPHSSKSRRHSADSLANSRKSSTISISWRNKKDKKRDVFIDRWQREIERNKNRTRVPTDGGLNEKTKQVIEHVSLLNEGTRKRYGIGRFSNAGDMSSSRRSRSSKSGGSKSGSSKSRSSKSSKLFSSRTSSSGHRAKSYDWRAAALQDFPALTPFPERRSPAARERARQEDKIKWKLRAPSCSQSKSSRSNSKSSRSNTSSKSTTVSKSGSEILTAQMYDYRGYAKTFRPSEVSRVTTPTRYPGARPPEVRAKARLDLLECVELKEKSRKKSPSTLSSASENSSPTSEFVTSTYSKLGSNCCPTCGGCVECVRVCVEHCRSLNK